MKLSIPENKLHKLLEVCDEELRSLANAFAHDVSTVTNEVVGRWCAFQVRGSIADHHNFQLIVSLQLTRVEVPNLRDRLSFSTASARRLINVESSIITVEVEQQLVGEQIVQRNVQLLSDGIDQRVKAARNQINFLVLRHQMTNEISETEEKKIKVLSVIDGRGLESRQTKKSSDR